MVTKTRINLAGNTADKNALIIALINSGYAVRYVEVKEDGTRKKNKVIEYWQDQTDDEKSDQND